VGSSKVGPGTGMVASVVWVYVGGGIEPGIGVNVGVGGIVVNVAEAVVSLEVGLTSVAFAVTVGRTSFGLDLVTGVFVGTGLEASVVVDEGLTSTLATTLASGRVVLAV